MFTTALAIAVGTFSGLPAVPGDHIVVPSPPGEYWLIPCRLELKKDQNQDKLFPVVVPIGDGSLIVQGILALRYDEALARDRAGKRKVKVIKPSAFSVSLVAGGREVWQRKMADGSLDQIVFSAMLPKEVSDASGWTLWSLSSGSRKSPFRAVTLRFDWNRIRTLFKSDGGVTEDAAIQFDAQQVLSKTVEAIEQGFITSTGANATSPEQLAIACYPLVKGRMFAAAGQPVLRQRRARGRASPKTWMRMSLKGMA